MKDKVTTKEQLIAELVEMRQRIAELEAAETERKRAEEALRETGGYLEKLLDYANAPIIVWDTEFRITRFNHAFEHLTGYTADQVIGQGLHVLFPDTGRDESLNKIERTSNGEYWESVEIPILCQDGDIRLVLWNSANIHAENGTTVLATIAQGTDITERVRVEEALKEYSERLEEMVAERTVELQAQYAWLDAILDSTTDGIVVTNEEGSIIQTNPVAQAWLTRTLSPEEAGRLREAVQSVARQACAEETRLCPDAQPKGFSGKNPVSLLELTGLDLELSAALVVQEGADALRQAGEAVLTIDVAARRGTHRRGGPGTPGSLPRRCPPVAGRKPPPR